MSDLVRVENESGAQYTVRTVGEGEKLLKDEPAVDGMGNPLPATYPEPKKGSAARDSK